MNLPNRGQVAVTPRVIPEQSLTAAEDAAIRVALCRCFPPDREVFAKTRAWHGTLPTWSVVVEHGDLVVAHAGIVEREILVGHDRVRAAGVQNVLVAPEHRKSDLFGQIMSVAMAEALRRQVDLGILFCTAELARIYAWVGWKILEDRSVVRVDEEGRFRPLPEKNVTMFYPLVRADIPPGDIHLLGNDW
jgi:predicted acetyltransferase